MLNNFYREIVQYSAAADSTIPNNKRKLEDTGIKQEYVEEEIKQESEGKYFSYNFIFAKSFVILL